MENQEGSQTLLGTDRLKALSKEKRDRVLDAVEEEILSVGYRAASTNEIAQRAGVSKGALFSYFPAKDVMFAAIVARHLEMARSHFVQHDFNQSGHSIMPRTHACDWVVSVLASIDKVCEVDPKFPEIAHALECLCNDKRAWELFASVGMSNVINWLRDEANAFVVGPAERAVQFFIAPAMQRARDAVARTDQAMVAIPAATSVIATLLMQYARTEPPIDRAQTHDFVAHAIVATLMEVGR